MSEDISNLENIITTLNSKIEEINEELENLQIKRNSIQEEIRFEKYLIKNNNNIYDTLNSFFSSEDNINFGRISWFIDRYENSKKYNEQITDLKNLIKIKNEKNIYHKNSTNDMTINFKVSEMNNIVKNLRKYGFKLLLKNRYEIDSEQCYMCNTPRITQENAVLDILYERDNSYGGRNTTHTILVKNDTIPFDITKIEVKLNKETALRKVDELKIELSKKLDDNSEMKKQIKTIEEMKRDIKKTKVYMKQIICPDCKFYSIPELLQNKKRMFPKWIEENMLEIVIK